MNKCKNKKDNFCEKYKRDAPPRIFCDRCKHYEETKEIPPACNRHIYNDELCLQIQDDGSKHLKNRKTCRGKCEWAGVGACHWDGDNLIDTFNYFDC